MSNSCDFSPPKSYMKMNFSDKNEFIDISYSQPENLPFLVNQNHCFSIPPVYSQPGIHNPSPNFQSNINYLINRTTHQSNNQYNDVKHFNDIKNANYNNTNYPSGTDIANCLTYPIQHSMQCNNYSNNNFYSNNDMNSVLIQNLPSVSSMIPLNKKIATIDMRGIIKNDCYQYSSSINCSQYMQPTQQNPPINSNLTFDDIHTHKYTEQIPDYLNLNKTQKNYQRFYKNFDGLKSFSTKLKKFRDTTKLMPKSLNSLLIQNKNNNSSNFNSIFEGNTGHHMNSDSNMDVLNSSLPNNWPDKEKFEDETQKNFKMKNFDNKLHFSNNETMKPVSSQKRKYTRKKLNLNPLKTSLPNITENVALLNNNSRIKHEPVKKSNENRNSFQSNGDIDSISIPKVNVNCVEDHDITLNINCRIKPVRKSNKNRNNWQSNGNIDSILIEKVNVNCLKDQDITLNNNSWIKPIGNKPARKSNKNINDLQSKGNIDLISIPKVNMNYLDDQDITGPFVQLLECSSVKKKNKKLENGSKTLKNQTENICKYKPFDVLPIIFKRKVSDIEKQDSNMKLS